MRKLLRILRHAAKILNIDRSELRHAAQSCLASAQMASEVELLFRPYGYEGNTQPPTRSLPMPLPYDHSGDDLRA